jgi:hypothetical protein
VAKGTRVLEVIADHTTCSTSYAKTICPAHGRGRGAGHTPYPAPPSGAHPDGLNCVEELGDLRDAELRMSEGRQGKRVC